MKHIEDSSLHICFAVRVNIPDMDPMYLTGSNLVTHRVEDRRLFSEMKDARDECVRFLDTFDEGDRLLGVDIRVVTFAVVEVEITDTQEWITMSHTETTTENNT